MLPNGAKFNQVPRLQQLLTLCTLLTLATPAWAQEDEDTPTPPPRHFVTRGRHTGPAGHNRLNLGEERLRNKRGSRSFEALDKEFLLRTKNEALEKSDNNSAAANDAAEAAPATDNVAPISTSANTYVAANTSSPATGSSSGSNNENESTIDSAARMKNGKFRFDFNKGSIEDVIKLISDITRKNFIIPEKIKGQKLTILCPTMVTAYEAYQAFLSALEINNLTLIKSGNFYKITNSKDAIKSPIPTYFDDANNVPWQDTLVTILLPLKYIDAQNTSNLIKGMISSDGTMNVFQPTNTIILSDYGNNIHRIKSILDKLDQEGGQEEMQVIPVENATASELAEKIKQIYDVDKKQGGSANKNGKKDENATSDAGNGVNISKIIPDDRTNQLIIVANHNSFQPIMDMIQKLDTQLNDEEGQIRVYQLKNAVAEDIANTLSSLAQGKSTSTNNKAKKDKKDSKKSGGDSAALFEGDVKITADKATNSLVIASSARDFKSVRKILEELDRPRLQVYVEGAILEVNVSNNKQFGTGWHSGIPFDNTSGNKDLAQGIGFVQSSSNSTMTTVTSASGVADLFNIFSGAIGGVLGQMITGTIGGTSVTIPSFGVVLKALRSDSNSKLLSEPYLTITDNEEGEVEVGQKIPFQEGYGSTLSNLSGLAGSSASSALSAYAGLYSRTDRIDVTLKMTLTPHINDSGKVRLEVDINIEDMVGKDEATGQPITATRKVKTVVIPDDHQTIVIGGLVRDRVRESESKIPLLGNIPVLGWLFKTRSWETEQVNLLIMLTPHIIRDRKDVENIARQRKAEFDRFQALFYGGTKEYRSRIGYERTNGLIATLHQEIAYEMQHFENGGEGTEDEILITPEPLNVDVSEEVEVEVNGESNSAAAGNSQETTEATAEP